MAFVTTKSESVAADYRDAELRDPRRSRRLVAIISKLERDPSKSFPQLMSSDAELEGFYRFVNNSKFTAADILAPHREATFRRAGDVRDVLVIHDTTNVEFPGEARRDGLGVTSTLGRQGFMCHVSLVVQRNAARTPLGLANLETFTRSGTKWRGYKDKRRHRRNDPERESLRWTRGVDAFERDAPANVHPIHVMDAEGDFFELLSNLRTHGSDFVIRAGNLHRVVEDEDGETAPLGNVIGCLEPVAQRTVQLSRRSYHKRSNKRNQTKRHPPRQAREATLHIASTIVRIRPTQYSGLKQEPVDVNVVRVWEYDAPDDCKPVEWVLFTTLKTGSVEDLTEVVDVYRERWVVEDYFKALKTGCSLEKRQVESYEGLVKVLALLAPIAARLLTLRGLAHQAPSKPANEVFDEVELRILATGGTSDMGPLPRTLDEAMSLLARMGGHLKSNGPPGWMVLSRGYFHLLTIKSGWLMAMKAQDL